MVSVRQVFSSIGRWIPAPHFREDRIRGNDRVGGVYSASAGMDRVTHRVVPANPVLTEVGSGNLHLEINRMPR